MVPGGVYPGGCRRERTSRPHEHTLLFATNLTPVTEKHKNRPQESQEILKMSTTTIDNADQPITAGSEEMEIFTAFPDKRKTNEPIDPVELRKMEDLLKAYMRNPSKRALPSKKQLAAVTSSLFKEGARKLSPKWNKTQLGAAIMHWLEVAISLPERKDQMQTYLEVSIHKGAPNLMDHQITSKEESGELSTMEISSPSTRAKGKPVPVVLSPQKFPADVEDVDEGELEPVPIFDESPDTFLEQFDRLLEAPELAITPGPNPLGVTRTGNVPESAEIAPIPEPGNGHSICRLRCMGLDVFNIMALGVKNR